MNTKYTKEMLEEAVIKSQSVAGVLRTLGIGLSGGMHSHISRRIKTYEIDTSHFTGQSHNLGKISSRRKTPDEILTITGQRVRGQQLRRALCETGVLYECSLCGCSSNWNEKVLVLHVDHIDGNSLDSRKENLRFLCPNCHSQTATYCRPRQPGLQHTQLYCINCKTEITRYSKSGLCKTCVRLVK